MALAEVDKISSFFHSSIAPLNAKMGDRFVISYTKVFSGVGCGLL